MKLAFNTWVYSCFPVWVPAYPLEEVVPRLAAIGYEGIELGAATPHAYPDYTGRERRREIKKLFETNNIALVSMTPAQSMAYIILPQAMRIVLPPLTNYAIGLLKDTSLCSLIGVNELMNDAKSIAFADYQPMAVFVLVAAIYFVMRGTLKRQLTHT